VTPAGCFAVGLLFVCIYLIVLVEIA